MHVLFLLDPFFDYIDPEHQKNRAFVLRYDLMPAVLKQQAFQDHISVVALDKLFEYSDNEWISKKNNLEVAKINSNQISKWLTKYKKDYPDLFNQQLNKDSLIELQQIFPSLQPDIIMCWGFSGEYLQQIFPNSKIFFCEHTAFYRYFRESDVFFEPSGFLKDSWEGYIKNLELTEKENARIEELKTYFSTNVFKNLNITKKSIGLKDDEKIIFYPGHFDSPYRLKYSNYRSDLEVIHELLENTPDSWKILYNSHPLNKKQDSSINSFIQNCSRVIDLSDFIGSEENSTLIGINLADVFVNSHSKSVFFAYLLDKKVIELDRFPTSIINKTDLNKICENHIITKNEIRKQNKLLFISLCKSITHCQLNVKDTYVKCISNLLTTAVSKNWSNLISYNSIAEIISKIQVSISNQSYSKDIRRVPNINEEIKYEIIFEDITTVGFDIFDTLLIRPFIKPTDLFYFISGKVSKILNSNKFDFSTARVEAEWLARKQAYDLNREDPSIAEIYDCLGKLFSIPPDKAELIKNLELQTEQNILIPRKYIYGIYELAKLHKKELIAISDMYMPSDFLNKILSHHGYSFDHIYVSAEAGKTKHSGLLFKKLIDECKIKANKIIFIGDNKESDYKQPTSVGIKSFIVPSPMQQLINSDILPVFYNPILSQTISAHIGIITNNLFDNPFRFFKKSIINDSYFLLGFNAFAPLLLSFCGWLTDQIRNHNYRHLLFCSRDCVVIEQIYKKIRDFIPHLPQSHYAYISRSSTLPFFKDKLNAPSLIDKYNSKYTAYDFLVKYFGDTQERYNLLEKDKKYLSGIKLDRIGRSLVCKYISENLVDEIDTESIDNFKKYINQLTHGESFAIIDSGARGTSRDALSDILNKDIDLYLFREFKYKLGTKNKIYSYHKDAFNYFRNGRPSLASKFYEPIISHAMESTCKGYIETEKGIKPIFEVENLTPISYRIQLIQKGMLDFVDIYIQTFKELSVELINEPTTDVYKAPIEYLYAGFDNSLIFSNLFHSDEMSENGAISLLMPPLKRDGKTINKLNVDKPNFRRATAFEKNVDAFIKKNENTLLIGPFLKRIKEFYINRFMQ